MFFPEPLFASSLYFAMWTALVLLEDVCRRAQPIFGARGLFQIKRSGGPHYRGSARACLQLGNGRRSYGSAGLPDDLRPLLRIRVAAGRELSRSAIAFGRRRAGDFPRHSSQVTEL